MQITYRCSKRNGVTHIVHASAFARDHDAYATVFAWHQMIETYLFATSGVAWTTLHPNMFMQSFLSVWSVKGGVYNAYTSKAVGFTALEDVAEAAAVILMEGPDKPGGKDYWFSADAALLHVRLAETLAAGYGSGCSQQQFRMQEVSQTSCGAAWFRIRTSVCKGRIRILRTGRGRKNGIHWKRNRRYKDTSRSRAIVTEGMGETTRQRAVGGCG